MKRLAFALAFALSFAAPAFALDFSTPITQMDGSPLTDEKGNQVSATLGSVSELALLSIYPDETNDVMNGKLKADDFTKEKLRRYSLARKIRVDGGKDVKLTASETALLRSLIGRTFPPLVAGQAILLIDPEGN